MNRKIKKSDVYRKYVFDEMSKRHKSHREDFKHYVDSLDDSKAEKLCKKCSHSRRNGVYSYISKGPDNWKLKFVDISNIYVRGINSKVNHYLRRNGWQLENICNDKSVKKHREFKMYGNIHRRSKSIIASRVGKNYYLIDGNHRAIKLGCNGCKKFELIYY
jgi:hypothetical protein